MGQICGLGEINFQIGEEERKKSFPDEPIYTAGRTCAAGACGAPWPKLSRTFRGFNDSLEETGSEVSEETGNYFYLPVACCSRRPFRALFVLLTCLERNMSICFFVIASHYYC